MTKKVSLETTVGSIRLSTCVYNASGPRTGTSSALTKIALECESGAVLTKSATLQSQPGNPHPRTWHDSKDAKLASVNSEGLPNNGIGYYISSKTINETYGVEDKQSCSKPYLVSISGKTLDDNLQMLDMIVNDGDERISGIELNLACPNVIGKPIIAYDFDQMATVLQSVSKLDLKNIPLGLKLPPYFDGPHYKQAADIINNYSSIIKYVACINTVGNAFVVDSIADMPFISSNSGFAGLSGQAIKYVALANVKKMRELLVPSIDVVGVGGVFSGEDAFELMLCGASAVQVGTCHWIEGPKCFDRICQELRDIMVKKGYTCVDDFKGKINTWNREGASKSRLERKAMVSDDTLAKKDTTSHFDLHSIFTAVLVVIIAVLLADKYML